MENTNKPAGSRAVFPFDVMVGSWEGTTKVWFEPGDPANESPTHAHIRSLADGRFIVYEYESSMTGRPLQGMAIYGFNQDRQKFEAAWIDSFHMATAMMFCEGSWKEKGFSILGHYEDANGGPPWGWRTEIEVIDPDQFKILMFNVSPEGEESKAVETIYTRKK